MISLMFAPNGAIGNKPAFVSIIAERRTGDKPLSMAMTIQFSADI